MANEYEDALEGLGFNLSDNFEDLDNAAEEATAQLEQEEQPTQDEVVEPQAEAEEQPESSLQEETPESFEAQEENIEQESEPEVDMLSQFNEMLGTSASSVEELRGLLNNEQPEQVQLDPQVEAIAKFVQETGRSVDDWFAYQAFNPSEMDDVAVMTTKLKQEYPDLSDEDAQLLLDSKYKIDEDMYSEGEARVGKLNLKMDAQKARQELEGLKESYAAPKRDSDPAGSEEIESPITEEWISAMSAEVDAIESLEINIGKDKTFSYGITDEYRATLKDKNAKLDEFFDPYVDDSGNWDIDTLSAHRAIIDNIDEIAASIYAQGLSDGQSKVVKQAVNPSTPNPTGGAVDASDARQKVQQQVLNALRGGDDSLRIKF